MDETSAHVNTADIAFTVTANGTSALTRAQTRSARFIAPSRGVRYVSDAPNPREARAAAGLASTRDGSVLCGLSAAIHLGLPVPPWVGLADDRPTDIAVHAGGAHPDRRDVAGRRLDLPQQHLTTWRGLATTTPARTWLDCAALIPIEHLVAMGDAVLRRHLSDSRELTSLTVWARRRRGVVAARQAIPLLDPGSQSPGESLARALLVLNGVPAPRTNVDIRWQGEWIARADLAWVEHRVVVEYDGLVHLDERQRRSDARRRNLLQEAGWLVIVFTADDLRRPWLMATLVSQALASRPAR